MENTLFGKLDTTDKKDIDVLEKLLEEKRSKSDSSEEERKPASA